MVRELDLMVVVALLLPPQLEVLEAQTDLTGVLGYTLPLSTINSPTCATKVYT